MYMSMEQGGRDLTLALALHEIENAQKKKKNRPHAGAD